MSFPKDQQPDQADATTPDRAQKAQPNEAEPGTNINRQLLALAVPTFGQLIAEPAFVLIDTAIVGHIGDTALAGLSVGSTIVLTTVGLCVFLAYGTTSKVAQLIGAGRRKEGMETGVDGLWLALIIGIVVSLALFLFARPLCWAMGARGAMLDQAIRYLQAIVFGVPGMLLVYAANGIFRGLEKVRITLAGAVFGAVVNTVLDFLFVFGFHWGVAGSGWATFAAQWAMGLFLVIPALRWARAEGASWRPHLAGILNTAGDGVPLFVRSLALRLSLLATVVLATHMGTQVLAAYQAVNSSWNFVLNMLDAIGIAGQALVATELGAGHRAQARTITSTSAKAGLYSGLVIGLGLIVAGFLTAPIFSGTPAVQTLIIAGMVVQGLFLPLAGWMWALDGILIGAGDFNYLAVTCSLTALAYLGALAGLGACNQAGLIPSDITRMVTLWAVFNIIFIGGRALFNGLRARTDKWMPKTMQPTLY
ncbi:MATE family efflux transporter [Bifidobacterium aemilianum]|uniref:MATE family efflux transporter n=1 Tax=Bifidobacterium aemilianum TaxID=2493120 RepID=A0A366K9H1_9BIFI|nr:MATE family efflux transporter [Bifidobacterium aemilianum]RBP97892.1 MATE family efflux transporter [Bifidobacterium aemilianum]